MTPVGLSKMARDPNVTFRKKVVPIRSEIQHLCGSTNELSTAHSHSLSQCVSGQLIHDLSSGHSTELSGEIRNLRSEMATMRDQLIKTMSIIDRYEIKLENYALQVVTLSKKLESYENRVSQPPMGPEPSLPRTPIQKMQPLKEIVRKQVKPPISSTLLEIPDTANDTTVGFHNTSSRTFEDDAPARCEKSTAVDQEWTEVTRRKSRGPVSLCGKAGPTVTTLKAAESVKFLHLWNMASGAEEVLSYLKQLCSTDSCTVMELTARGSYKSYKIGVPAALYEKCYSIDVWPINARIKPWINYRRPAGSARAGAAAGASPPIRQPFRGASIAQ